MVITLTRKGKMEMKKNDQIFQSMIATLLWKGTHILSQKKKLVLFRHICILEFTKLFFTLYQVHKLLLFVMISEKVQLHTRP